MSFRPVLIGLCLSVSVASMHALTIEEQRSNWRFYILEPSLEIGDPLFSGLLLQLEEALSGVEYHMVDREELVVLQAQAKEMALNDQREKMFSIQRRLDNLLFNDAPYIENAKTRREIRRELKQAEEVYDEIHLVPVETIPVQPQRSLERVTTLPTVVELVNTDHLVSYAKLLAAREDLQQVFYTKIETISDYQVISVWVYNSLTDAVTKITEEIARMQELTEITDRVVFPVIETLAGQQLAELHIQVFSQDGSIEHSSEIRINDEVIGYGEFHSRFFPSGYYTISANLPKQQTETKDVVLISKEERIVQFHSRMQVDDAIQLISIPPGARVYQDSLYLGLTPLELQRPSVSHHLLLQRDLYYDAWTVLMPTSSDIVSVSLLSKRTDIESELRKKRNRFYTAVAIMAATIPFPIVFSALYQERASFLQSSALTSAARAENQQLHDIYYYTFWGTLGISISATTYMAVRLGEYIHYANSTAEDWADR